MDGGKLEDQEEGPEERKSFDLMSSNHLKRIALSSVFSFSTRCFKEEFFFLLFLS